MRLTVSGGSSPPPNEAAVRPESQLQALPFAVRHFPSVQPIGRGLVGIAIAEFYTTISGLGYMISRYAKMFETDKTFVPVILLMFLGIALTTARKWV